MAGYKVTIEQECTNSHREEAEWGSWSEEYSNSLVKVERDDKSPDINSTHQFSREAKAYVVWVEYSYGDSFGNCSRGGVEAVGIFEDIAVAEELATAIQRHSPDCNTGDWENKYKLKLKTSDGQEFDIYTGSWHDYFGGLDEVHVERVFVD